MFPAPVRPALFLLLVLAGTAAAQPTGWLVIGQDLRVLNLSTNQTDGAFTIPNDFEARRGVLTPDGRYYLLPTNRGIARFVTNPAAFDGMLTVEADVDRLTVEPVGTRLHAIGDFGHAVIDWETGALLSVECCARPSLSFTPDGRTSVYVQTRTIAAGTTETEITAFSEPGHTVRWSLRLPGGGHFAIGETHLAVNSRGEVVVLNLEDGVEGGRVARSGHLAWRGQTLIVGEFGYTWSEGTTRASSPYLRPMLLCQPRAASWALRWSPRTAVPGGRRQSWTCSRLGHTRARRPSCCGCPRVAGSTETSFTQSWPPSPSLSVRVADHQLHQT
jgi:hypothetical protein